MSKNFFKQSAGSEGLRAGPLDRYFESAAASLAALGYAGPSVRVYLWAAADFGRWLTHKRVQVGEVDEHVVDAFVAERRRQGKLHRSHRAAIRHVLEHLREKGVLARPVPDFHEKPADRVLRQYEVHLRTERGLSDATVVSYRRFAGGFLVERFGDGPFGLRKLRPVDVSKFLLRQAPSLTPGLAGLMTSALRSFFRFLLQRGEIDLNLAAAVLSVADRTQASPPKFLEPDEVERLLAACERSTNGGRRNYALLLLLARLGLRAGEVVALELDDIDWRVGEITIPGKGRQRERLPLPEDVGEALAAYLRRTRPRCATRRVFVRMRAPLRGLAGPSTVSTIVRRALERADLHPPRLGAHLLRHSLATGMLRRGASMAEIGQLLRHRSANTTELYAKVDFDGLRSLAQPWPGSGGGQ